MKGPGQITAPVQTRESITEEGSYPQSSDGTYPVLTKIVNHLCEGSRCGYEEGDEIVIDPPEGSFG